jgi:NAD(P)-dependent dehydrogenase (short-subunit alcohol dehydrogenase family)
MAESALGTVSEAVGQQGYLRTLGAKCPLRQQHAPLCHGKTAIVTGGYAGLGLETTRTLSSAGATVIVPTRDVAKAKEALRGIVGVEIETMDLIDPTSIEAFAARFRASGRPLHILVNSAGIMALPALTLDSLVRDQSQAR